MTARPPADGPGALPEHSGAWVLEGDAPSSGDRYATRQLLGQGGMGRVYVAWDPRLRRDVARKEALGAPGSPEWQRLVREARIMGSLEHPGIVAVHDTGEADDGRPWYTMQLVRGRSLTQAAADATDLTARLALVDAVRRAAEAVGHAHRAGIVHRDLKPDNVLLAGPSEVFVVDWGLARPVDADEDDAWAPVISQLDPTRAGTAPGTPAYMAPEQIEGGEVGPPTDVWALGCALHQVLTGQKPFDAPNTQEVFARILAGRPTPVRALEPEVPPALDAIVRRCLERDPSRRPADGDAVARLLAAWQRQPATPDWAGGLPWGIAASCALLALATLGLALWRGSELRSDLDAALARQDALLATADNHLAASLAAQALHAADAGDQGRAEILAAHSLALAENASARSVLARFGHRERPTLVLDQPLPDCLDVRVASTGGHAICRTEATVRGLDAQGGPTWERTLAARDLRLSVRGRRAFVTGADGRTGFVLDGRDGNNLGPPGAFTTETLPRIAEDRTETALLTMHFGPAPLLMSQDPEQRTQIDICQDTGGAEQALRLDGGDLLLLCADHTVRRRSPDGDERVLVRELYTGDDMVWKATVDPSESRLAVATLLGRVGLVDLQTGEVLLWAPMSQDALRALAISPDGQRVAASVPGKGTWVYDTRTPDWPLVLPHDAETLGFGDQGDLVLGATGRLRRWRLPGELNGHLLDPGGGISGLDWRDDVLAVATSNALMRWDRSQPGQAPTSCPLVRGKDTAVLPDGDLLAVQYDAGPPGRSVRLGADGVCTDLDVPQARRVIALASGHSLFAAYSNHPTLLAPDGRAVPGAQLLGEVLFEAETSPDRRLAAILTESGFVYTLADGDPPVLRRLGRHEGAVATAVGPDGTWIALGNEHHAWRIDASDGHRLAALSPAGSALVDLAASPDGRWLAGATATREILVWQVDDGQIIARLTGHTAKIASLAFSQDGSTLASGSWDGLVRLWDLTALQEGDPRTPAALEAAWGLDLTAALGLPPSESP